MSRIDPQRARAIEETLNWSSGLVMPQPSASPIHPLRRGLNIALTPQDLSREVLLSRSPAQRLTALYALAFHPQGAGFIEPSLRQALQDLHIAGRLNSYGLRGGMPNAFHAAYLHYQHAGALAGDLDPVVDHLQRYFLGNTQKKVFGSGDSARIEAEAKLVAAVQIVVGTGRCTERFDSFFAELLNSVVDVDRRRSLSSRTIVAALGSRPLTTVSGLNVGSAALLKKIEQGMATDHLDRLQRHLEVLSVFAPPTEKYFEVFADVVHNHNYSPRVRLHSVAWLFLERPAEWERFTAIVETPLVPQMHPYQPLMRDALVGLSQKRSDDLKLFHFLSRFVLDSEHWLCGAAIDCMPHFASFASQARSLLTLSALTDESLSVNGRKTRASDVFARSEKSLRKMRSDSAKEPPLEEGH